MAPTYLPVIDETICAHFHLVRGHRVLLQTDLAQLLGVPLERLVPAGQTFPGEFCFPLEPAEVALMIDDSWKLDQPIHAFTEHGAFLVAFLLNTPESLAMGIGIARAFARLRHE